MQARLTAAERMAIAATVLGALLFVAGSAFLASSDLLVDAEHRVSRPGPDETRSALRSVPPTAATPHEATTADGERPPRPRRQ